MLCLNIGIIEIKIGNTPDLGSLTICFYFSDIGKIQCFDSRDILRICSDRIFIVFLIGCISVYHLT